jgi:uncharacterized protein (TIGR00251 family)
VKLRIKVKPNSKTDEVIREADGTIKVKIKAQPMEGKANKYLIEYLSKILNLPKSKIVLSKGETNAFKTFDIDAGEDYLNNVLSRF